MYSVHCTPTRTSIINHGHTQMFSSGMSVDRGLASLSFLQRTSFPSTRSINQTHSMMLRLYGLHAKHVLYKGYLHCHCIAIFFSLPFPSSRSNLELIEDTLAVLRDLTIRIEAFYRNPPGKSTTSLFILKRLESCFSERSSNKEVSGMDVGFT